MYTISKFASILLVLFVGSVSVGADPTMPDVIELKGGKTVRGLIIRNEASSITLQQEHAERTIPKTEIVRIRDVPGAETLFMQMFKPGKLPPWRVIANELRSHDAIKKLEEIPATMIDNGAFKNVPYRSFRVNRDVELNIYGDPDDPAGIELGIYGRRSGDRKLRETLRQYLAGYLTTREEIGALYAIGLEEGLKRTKHMTVEVTPKDAPDAYGAWWVGIYNEKALDNVRLTDAEYGRLTLPMSEVVDRQGRVLDNVWDRAQMKLSKRMEGTSEEARVLLRGFYRDKDGKFRLIRAPAAANGETSN